MGQQQAPYRVIAHKDQILLDHRLRQMDWQPISPETELHPTMHPQVKAFQMNRVALQFHEYSNALYILRTLQEKAFYVSSNLPDNRNELKFGCLSDYGRR